MTPSDTKLGFWATLAGVALLVAIAAVGVAVGAYAGWWAGLVVAVVVTGLLLLNWTTEANGDG